MPTQISTKDPLTGRAITFTWNGEAPPTEENYQQVWEQARKMQLEKGLIPPALLSGRPQTIDPRTPKERDEAQSQGLLKVLGDVIELAPSLALLPISGGMSALPGMALNMGVNAATGAAKGALTGEGAGDEALLNAGLGVVGDYVGKAAPYVGNIIGQAFGGLVPAKKTAMAFMREGARQHGEGKLAIGLANTKRTREGMGHAGGLIERAEEANPTQLSLPNVARRGYENVAGPATTANFPTDVRENAEEFVKKYVKQQSAELPKKIKWDEVPEPAEFRETPETRVGRRRRPMLGKTTPAHDAVPVDDGVIDITPERKGTVLPNDKVSMRRAGDLKRSAGQRSASVIESRQSKIPIPADIQSGQQMDAAMEKAWREAQYEADTPKNLPGRSDNLFKGNDSPAVGPIESANQRMSDLHTMNQANQALKDPSIGGRVGQFTTRAAMGIGLANALGQGTGLSPDWSTNSILGTLLGPVFLNPRMAAVTGNMVGTGAKHANTARKTANLISDSFPESEEEKKKKVRRRRVQ